ncbi:uncharacterized protein LOC143289449 [Babylonia areolata]|uniref:uncharacterized protein LOC143289449 n=1 Tax=Babylonia areolata TaxID=304850 RepID=UPI003FD69202
MEWSALSCLLFAIFLSVEAQSAVSLPQRVKKKFSDLKELLQEGDSQLKERIEEGLEHVKEQRKEGDRRLKEELDEDVEWLKERQDKRQRQTEDEVAEGEAKMNKEITELKEEFGKLRDSIKQWTQPSSAVDDLRQQMSDFQAELKSTKQQLQTVQEEIRFLKASDVDKEERLNSTQAGLKTTQEKLQTTQDQIGSLKASDDGSLFIRWGHGQCPSSTSLVYSGVAGGSGYGKPGGGSNYLCLVMTPQVDNTTLPSAPSYLYGAEYQDVPGRDNQDVVCSVCRAPQATTLMIPATRTCPSGWTAQYRGHIMATNQNHRGRTEFVCVDEGREYRQGGEADRDGALFYPVLTICISLPCPPFAEKKVLTCVVCSV